MRDLAITFDVDWAPDWCVAAALDLCRRRRLRATFFATHPSAILSEIAADPQFEIGIHPNFTAGSTHGDSLRAVLDYCMDLAPGARAIRTHSLYQSMRLFDMIASDYPRIDTDVSLFLPGHPALRPTDLYIGKSGRRLVRLPTIWEDDVFAGWPGRDWSRPPQLAQTGVQIFCFHPIHVALNTDSLSRYEALAAEAGGVSRCTHAQSASFANAGDGARTFLETLARMAASEFVTVSTIADRFREAA